MKYSALYFIPNPSAQITSSEALTSALTKRLESAFPRATREDSFPWTLQHRLLRDVPPTPKPGESSSSSSSSSPPPSANHPHSYQHLLRLSYASTSRAYCLVQQQQQQQQHDAAATKEDGKGEGEHAQSTRRQEVGQGIITSIPMEELDSHYALVVTQWGQLWAPHRILDIPSSSPGATYTLGGDFALRIGELRVRRSGPQSAAILSPGVVVVLTTAAGDDSDAGEGEGEDDEVIDFAPVQERLREVWKRVSRGVDFGKAEVREIMQGGFHRGGNMSEEDEREAVVRMWCEALKLRG